VKTIYLNVKQCIHYRADFAYYELFMYETE